MKFKDRECFNEIYANEVVECMDLKDLIQFAVDEIEEDVQKLSDEEFIKELQESPYEYLLENHVEYD